MQIMRKLACSILIVLSFLLLFIANPVFAGKVIYGTVIKVLDGDSIIVRDDKKHHEVRLWGIDSPEYDQPYGKNARKQSTKLLKGKKVSVTVITKDNYGRLVGVVYAGNTNINEILVTQGSAWVYTKYCKESICRQWKKMERSARNSKAGLWAGNNALPPWKWRHAKKPY